MNPSKTLIVFLHGSGGNGPELSAFFQNVPIEEFAMNSFYNVAKEMSIDLLCPTAKSRPYTAMMNQNMNVWFDRSTDFMRKGIEDVEDLSGADESVQQILNIVEEKATSYESIFVGGFSMGGCLALHLLRTEAAGKLPSNVKGLFSMGSFLVEQSAVLGDWKEGPDGAPRSTLSVLPVFMMHGLVDSLIAFDWGQTTATNLLLKGYNVHFKGYPGIDHEVAEEEMVDLIRWVEDVKISAENTAAALSKLNTDTTNQLENDDEDGEKTSRGNRKVSAEDLALRQQARMDVEAEYDAIVENAEGVYAFTTGPHLPTKTTTTEQGTEVVEHSYVPYTIQQSDRSSGSSCTNPNDNVVRIYFHVPESKVSMLIGRPVLACGASFDLQAVTVDAPSTVAAAMRSSSGSSSSTSSTSSVKVKVVMAEVQSSDPHYTAKEIGKRLMVRLGSNGESLQACPMS